VVSWDWLSPESFLEAVCTHLAALALGFLGAVVGHRYIDSTIRICPKCGLVLRIVNDLLI
jgi:hypothetical protein